MTRRDIDHIHIVRIHLPKKSYHFIHTLPKNSVLHELLRSNPFLLLIGKGNIDVSLRQDEFEESYPMKLLVCISVTPETTAPIRFTEDGQSLITEGINYIINPYDEWYALVRAIELKEQYGGQVDIVHVGPASHDVLLRKALAIGADAAHRIDFQPKDAWQAAYQIAHFAQDRAYDIIFAGKETIDYQGALVPGMVAEMLQLPFASFSNYLEVDGQHVKVRCEIEGGYEEYRMPMPLVVSAAKGLAEQRIPNMRGIMMAKRKPLEVIPPQEVPAKSECIGFEKPPQRSSVKLIDPDNVEELVRLLHEEARVI